MLDVDSAIEFIAREMERKIELIPREVEVEAIRGKASAIIGPRRSGKTWLLYSLRKGNFMHIDFEDLAFSGFEAKDFLRLYEAYVEYFGSEPKQIFFDEIQEVHGWEKMVRTCLNRYEAEIYMTGSSSKLLSREIATSLRGRSMSWILLPFSFSEFLKARSVEMRPSWLLANPGKVLRKLREFLSGSAYPEVVMTGNTKILSEYMDSIVYKDFVDRFGVENTALARFLFEFFYRNFANEFSARKVANFAMQSMNVAKNTVYKYLHLLPETMNVFFVEKFSKSPYLSKSWPKKAYVADTGISSLMGAKDFGRRMENAVFLHLLRGTNTFRSRRISFLRTQKGEVDFIVSDGQKRAAIQVTFANSTDEIDRREIHGIEGAFSIGIRRAFIISWGLEEEMKIGNRRVPVIPLWKFLLGFKVFGKR